MSGFDKEKFYKETSEGFKKKKLDEVNELFGDNSSKKTEDLKKSKKEKELLAKNMLDMMTLLMQKNKEQKTEISEEKKDMLNLKSAQMLKEKDMPKKWL